MKTIIVITLFLATLVSATGYGANQSNRLRLYFPNIELDKKNGERIEEIKIFVACGHIEAITAIPDDWNIEVIRAISAVEELHASAGHGASMIEDINKLNGIIKIRTDEKECFDVSATITTSGQEKARQIDLSKTKLKLLP